MTKIPNIQGELVGFRGWYVNEDLGLESQTDIKTVWTPGENVAVCERGKYMQGRFGGNFYVTPGLELEEVPIDPTPQHEAPNQNCGCGLYAHHRLGQVTDSHFGSLPWLRGVVTLYGRVEVHASHEGMRSSKSCIAALELPEGHTLRAIAKAVAAEYGVPLVPSDELERVASEFGQRCPEEYFPEVITPEVNRPNQAVQFFTTSGYNRASSSSGLWQVLPTTSFNITWSEQLEETPKEIDPWDGQVKPKKRKPKRNSARQGPPSSRGAQFKQNRKS